jgi:glycosyltransferase involved in cell wall biosynthesis
MRALFRRYQPAIVHGHSSLGGAISRLAATGTGIPAVYTPNGISRMPWALTVERYLRARTHRLIAVSEGEREFALRMRLAGADRITTIRNGISLTPPEPLRPGLRERLGIPRDALLVGCLGRLTWQKAPEIYVTACGIVARERPDAHFVLIGSGPHATRVEDGVSGLLVPADDPLELARAMLGLLDDPARRAAFAAAGADRLEALFDVRIMGEQTAEVYQQAIGERRRSPSAPRRVAAPVAAPIG